LPFKLNQDRRRHIPKQKHKVLNSAAYDASLRQRGAWFRICPNQVTRARESAGL
jgi:hypothetical protein